VSKEKKKQPPAEDKDEDDPDAGLDEAWQRSPIGIRANPKRNIKGLVYTEDDKLENRKGE
jgi:hypothetical protein